MSRGLCGVMGDIGDGGEGVGSSYGREDEREGGPISMLSAVRIGCIFLPCGGTDDPGRGGVGSGRRDEEEERLSENGEGMEADDRVEDEGLDVESSSWVSWVRSGGVLRGGVGSGREWGKGCAGA